MSGDLGPTRVSGLPASRYIGAVASTSLPDRDAVVGWVIVAAGLGALAIFGASDPGRWPWTLFCWILAAPYLTLLAPPAQSWLRRRVVGNPSLIWSVPGSLAALGLAVTLAAPSSPWEKAVLWPLCTAGAVAIVVLDRGTEASGLRLVGVALVLGVLAGAWESTLFIRVPGGTKIGLAFFAALDLALFLFIAVKPLRSFDVRFGLSARELAFSGGALAALVVAALPVGLAIGFLGWEPKWQGASHAAARLFGLIIFVGLPEEMLFRGLVQEGLSRLWTPRAGWIIASLLFGLAHITKHAPPLNWRYALVASLAGLAYGWVYARTGKLSAAAVTHGAADWIWSTYLVS